MSEETSIYRMIADQDRRNPDAVAIAAPDRLPLTYSRLRGQIEYTVRTLNTMGIGRGDRVAIVLPNGPEMAVAFLSVASGATAVPLNPTYRAEEFDFYLSDLKAKALIVQSGIDSPAIEVARRQGISVITLIPDPLTYAGNFSLLGADQPSAHKAGFAEPDDISLVVHTSGTTSRPKLVPLTQANICFSFGNVRAALNLTECDRYLNVMPLFHLHGLGCVLASLAAGAMVFCTPEFDAPVFFDWMEEFLPSWYSAVPTMHQAIMARTPARKVTPTSSLRFIRSSSAALPRHLKEDLESTFKVPVIEAYGMSETFHQIAANPLPPGKRMAGSVGLPAGAEVAIMDESGDILPAETTGEIVIRGKSVMLGYENNPTANAAAFSNGWFRTGDQGYLDSEGYLFISGRLKEIINHGGEKISPREVDELLMSHPAVAQAVTFAIPHAQLGEDVAAAVVLRPRENVTARMLREFAALRLAHFKVPRQIVFLQEIPKGPTGKLQRIGLAEKLGLTAGEESSQRTPTEYVSPSTPWETLLATIWSEVLRIEKVGIHDDFLELGGDSILAMKILSRVFEAIGVEVSLPRFFETPTVADIALAIEELMSEETA